MNTTSTEIGDAAAICRSATLLLAEHGWAALPEVPLPDGRRADLLALAPDGRFAIVEVKSCPRDFLTDHKWPDYRAWCDLLYFAVDERFAQALLPADTGLIVASDQDAAILRAPPEHPLAGARRRSLTLRFALLAARRASGLVPLTARSL